MYMELRPISMKDADWMLRTRNLESIRMQSINTSVISLEDHIKWMESTLQNTSRKVWITEADAFRIGVLRLDGCHPGVEVSIYVHPNHSSNGYGTQMITESIKLAKIHFPNAYYLKAIIKSTNAASIKVFQKVGFTKAYGNEDISEYYFNLGSSET
ncbi:GNAT family N-acetyltransferase [Paenibacillus marinisediminis]